MIMIFFNIFLEYDYVTILNSISNLPFLLDKYRSELNKNPIIIDFFMCLPGNCCFDRVESDLFSTVL